MSKRPRGVAVLVLALVVCGQVVLAGSEPAQLSKAKALVVCKIEGRPERKGDSSLRDNPKVEGYPVVDMKVIRTRADIEKIGALIAGDRVARRSPAACFYPGMALTFVGESSSDVVLVCLECQNLSGVGPNDLVRMSNATFDQLLALYKELFLGNATGLANYRMKLSAHPVTPLAKGASAAPGRPAAYAER